MKFLERRFTEAQILSKHLKEQFFFRLICFVIEVLDAKLIYESIFPYFSNNTFEKYLSKLTVKNTMILKAFTTFAGFKCCLYIRLTRI